MDRAEQIKNLDFPTAASAVLEEWGRKIVTEMDENCVA